MDDFLVFAAGMRIKYGTEKAILKLRSSDKTAGRLFGGLFYKSRPEIYRCATRFHGLRIFPIL